jgi:hypothetical protein
MVPVGMASGRGQTCHDVIFSFRLNKKCDHNSTHRLELAKFIQITQNDSAAIFTHRA